MTDLYVYSLLPVLPHFLHYFLLSFTESVPSVLPQKKIGTWLPRTTWVCVGDSTQADPEAYAEFYNQLVALNKGGRVARIFIRKVVGVNPELEVKLNAPERFEKAFNGIPNTIWKVFEDGHELMDEVEKLKSERAASKA
jgi:phosphatidate phosphatase APP1